jgi:hypothetical protein
MCSNEFSEGELIVLREWVVQLTIQFKNLSYLTEEPALPCRKSEIPSPQRLCSLHRNYSEIMLPWRRTAWSPTLNVPQAHGILNGCAFQRHSALHLELCPTLSSLSVVSVSTLGESPDEGNSGRFLADMSAVWQRISTRPGA